MSWKRYDTEEPQKSGTYLVVTIFNDEPSVAYPSTCDYYKKGDLITTLYPEGEISGEARLMRALFDESLQVRADVDGFYEYDESGAWLITPSMWRELPEPPEGCQYDCEVE